MKKYTISSEKNGHNFKVSILLDKKVIESFTGRDKSALISAAKRRIRSLV